MTIPEFIRDSECDMSTVVYYDKGGDIMSVKVETSYEEVVRRFMKVARLSVREVAGFTGVTPREVNRWLKRESTPGVVSRRRVLDTSYVLTQLAEVYRPEGVEIWLHSPNRDLSGARPADLLEQGETTHVLRVIERLRGMA